MLTLKLLREQPDFVIRKLAVKNFDAKEIVEKINLLDVERRACQTELDACLAEQKKLAAKIGGLMKEGKREEAEAVKSQVADSHTCTYGALGGFSTGVGSTDLGVAMATGEAWFKVPDAIKVVLTGTKPEDITGKDVILTLIGMIGVDGALYQSLEFTGPGVHSLSMTDRFTIANMAIEAGGKNGIFPVDEKTIAYIEGRYHKPFDVVEADEDAHYSRVVEIDLSSMKPVVSFPHLPENTKVIGTFGEIKIDQVVIGSCTNGRLEDLAIAARIFKGHKVHPNVRCIVIPATPTIYLQAMHAGFIETFIDAGCAVSTPTCGPCLGGYMGILANGEKCVSTTNRNFIGRMGPTDSEIYLAGPQVAAASAILGRIAVPKEVK